MLTGTLGVFYRKEVIVKMDECLFYCIVLIALTRHKSLFQTIVLPVVPLQEMDKI